MNKILVSVFAVLILVIQTGCSKDKTGFIPAGNLTGNYSNKPPVAYAGADRSLPVLLNTVFLGGYGMDPDGSSDIISYEWVKIAGPLSFNMLTPSEQTTTVSNLEVGNYQFEYTVKDRFGLTGKDTVIVTISSISGGTLIHGLNWNITGRCGIGISGIHTYLPAGDYDVYISPKYGGILTGWRIVPLYSGPADTFYYEIRNGNMEITERNMDCSLDDTESYSVAIIPK